MHWADKCLHKNERSTLIVESSPCKDKTTEEINTVLNMEEIGKAEIFLAEASKSVIYTFY